MFKANVVSIGENANYHKGLVEVYRLENDNTLTLKDSVTYEGKGPRPEQDKSHAHYADLTPDNKLVTINLGDDKVHTYDVSEEIRIAATPLCFVQSTGIVDTIWIRLKIPLLYSNTATSLDNSPARYANLPLLENTMCLGPKPSGV